MKENFRNKLKIGFYLFIATIGVSFFWMYIMFDRFIWDFLDALSNKYPYAFAIPFLVFLIPFKENKIVNNGFQIGFIIFLVYMVFYQYEYHQKLEKQAIELNKK